MRYLIFFLVPICLIVLASPCLGTVCELPDIGGTAEFPPPCPDGYVGVLNIIDGLPPGSTITGPARLTDFSDPIVYPGGNLGGERYEFLALLEWTASGTGDLLGFTRHIGIPVACIVDTEPRNPGNSVQIFNTDFSFLSGTLVGDPDFEQLIILAGTDNGMPCPGTTKLDELPSGDFNVDSFFDITYNIQFTGAPGSILEGVSGSTGDTQRYQAGEVYLPTIDHNCLLPDNGTGTIDFPPACPDGYEGTLTIVDGLPAGTEITGPAVLTEFMVTMQLPGGSLGGEILSCDALLDWQASGTGLLAGFQRSLVIPIICEIHTAPRNPGDPEQVFSIELMSLGGDIFGDPDFCDLHVSAGTNNGLPSPGSTTLTRVPTGEFAVDSFFDITYQIDFNGCPGSILEGLSGSTVDTERFQAGEPYLPTIDHNCLLPDNGTGTIDLPPECPDGYVGNLIMLDGLPPGTTITGEAVLKDISVVSRGIGGILGGEFQFFDAVIHWQASGTGLLLGFERTIFIPVSCEINTAPRTPGDPVQTFEGQFMHLSGQVTGDPDFDYLGLLAGDIIGQPSPGSTTLTQLPSGEFAVDSFFDITYVIEFQGAPGSILEGLAGTTTDTERYQAGEPYYVSGVEENLMPALGILYQNKPNPFNPATVISYELPAGGGHVAVDIFDVRGRHVCNLVNSVQSGGLQFVTWNGTDGQGRRASSGVYFYTLKTANQTVVRKMAIIK